MKFTNLPQFIKNIGAGYFGTINAIKRNYKRKYFDNLLRSRHSWSIEDYKKYEEVRLKEVLDLARKNVPYYRQYWNNNPGNHLILDNWPVLEKDQFRNNWRDFLSDVHKNSRTINMFTSGSSGKPMHFLLSKECYGMWYAMYDERIKANNGIDINKDWFGTFAGRMVCNSQKKEAPYWVINKPGKQVYFSSYNINRESVKDYVEAISAFNLKYLMGYVSSIYNICKLAGAIGLKLPKLKLIITNAEPLFEYQRELIAKSFNCRVIQTYSGCEYAFGGSEDGEGNMLLWPEAGILEVEHKDGTIADHGRGELLATGFLNEAMPLIRYRIGDSGEISSRYSSRYPYRILSEIDGRTDDIIYAPNGNFIGRLDVIFKSDMDIIEAQIIQESEDRVSLNMVEGPSITKEDIDKVIKNLSERLGEEVKIIYRKADSIPRGKNGKFKAVISNLNPTKTKITT